MNVISTGYAQLLFAQEDGLSTGQWNYECYYRKYLLVALWVSTTIPTRQGSKDYPHRPKILVC